jgi:hypothetical protein
MVSRRRANATFKGKDVQTLADVIVELGLEVLDAILST